MVSHASVAITDNCRRRPCVFSLLPRCCGNKLAARLNGRPRQTLQFMNPAEKLVETLDIASTG
jgi:hypothetical protein